jgi:Arc/MetJ-type ribon-helix-helix transcriptional regulator
MHANSQKILISLPQKLLSAIDVVKTEKNISRSALIREALIRDLDYYNRHERNVICFLRDNLEANWGRAPRVMRLAWRKGEPSVENDENDKMRSGLGLRRTGWKSFFWKSLLAPWG